MQTDSEQPPSILKAKSRTRHESDKHSKSHAVQQTSTSRMKKVESKDLARRHTSANSQHCPVCGSVVRGKQGCCVSCGTILDDSEPLINYAMKPMVPIKRLLFVHLDVESGKMSYIESNGDRNLTGELNLKQGGI